MTAYYYLQTAQLTTKKKAIGDDDRQQANKQSSVVSQVHFLLLTSEHDQRLWRISLKSSMIFLHHIPAKITSLYKCTDSWNWSQSRYRTLYEPMKIRGIWISDFLLHKVFSSFSFKNSSSSWRLATTINLRNVWLIREPSIKIWMTQDHVEFLPYVLFTKMYKKWSLFST